MRWLLAFVLLLSAVGARPAVAADLSPDGPAVPSLVAADGDAPLVPHPSPSEDDSFPDDEAASPVPSSLGPADIARLRRPDAPTMPRGTDLSVPRPPPTR